MKCTLKGNFISRKGANRQISKITRAKLLNLLLIGLILRFALAPFTSHPYDVEALYVVVNDLLAGLDVYATNSFSYPPLWAYIEYPALSLASFFLSPKLFGMRIDALDGLTVENWKLPPLITSPLFNILFKLPLIIADLLIGLLVYNIVKELRDEKSAKLSLILWFLNPLVIFVSTIHGQFDTFPALLTVLSFCLFCRRSFFASGLSLGLGALFKIYPLALTPLYLVSAGTLEIDKRTDFFGFAKIVSANCLKFVAGMLISFFIFLSPLVGSNLVHNVFLRTEVITALGGLGIFGVTKLPGFEWLFAFVSDNSTLFSSSLAVICLSMTIFVSFFSLSRRRDFIKTFILGHIIVLIVIYLTSLTVNPQYLLWILPFLILSYGLYRYNLIELSLLSISGLVYLIGISGPLFFFYPLAIFTPLLSVEAIYANVNFFEQGGGVGFLVAAGLLAVIVFLYCFIGMIMRLRKKENSKISNAAQQKSPRSYPSLALKLKWHPSKSSKILAYVFIIALIGQSLAYMQPFMQKNIHFSIISHSFENGSVQIEYNISSGSYPTNLQVFATPTSKSVIDLDKELFIYYDENHRSPFVEKPRWIGILDHVPFELELRGYRGSIQIVNATELENIMQQKHNSVIIVPSGVFPKTIHAGNKSFVGNWLQSGGTLIWVGGIFAHFSGREDGVEFFSVDDFGEVQKQILGFVLFNETAKENERFAANPTDFSQALDLRYPDALFGAYTSEVTKHGGLILGKTTSSQNPRTSIAYVPIGNGHLILFGGRIERAFTSTGEDIIAHDIAQILCSGVLFSTGIVEYNLHELERNTHEYGTISIANPMEPNVKGIIVAVFSKSPYNRYFAHFLLEAPYGH